MGEDVYRLADAAFGQGQADGTMVAAWVITDDTEKEEAQRYVTAIEKGDAMLLQRLRGLTMAEWEAAPTLEETVATVSDQAGLPRAVIGALTGGQLQAVINKYEEYGREFSERYKFRDGAPWWSEEFVHIAEEQCRREDEMARRCNRVLISDTDALATAIWHERYMGSRSAEVQAIADGRSCGLYLVTDVDIPFVQDGYRDGERLRAWMHGRFIDELTRLGRRFAVVSGSTQDRLTAAVHLIDDLLTPVTNPRGGTDDVATMAR